MTTRRFGQQNRSNVGTTLLKPGQPDPTMDPKFRSGSQPALVSFGFSKIDPPAGVYIQRDDVLFMQGISQLGAETITVFFRLLLPLAPQPGQPDQSSTPPAQPAGFVGPGYIQTISRQLVLAGARVGNNLAIQLAEGYLLSVVAIANNALVRGATFVRAVIVRGTSAPTLANAAAFLFADYITNSAPVGWPGGRQLSPADGPGFLQVYAPANPAAGADLALATNTVGRVRINSFGATFTASAAVGNRVVSFVLTLVGVAGAHFTVQDTVAVTASQVVRYSLASGGTNVRGAGAGTAANPLDVTLPIPSPAIGANLITIGSTTQGILAGDQWSGILATTEEWLDLF